MKASRAVYLRNEARSDLPPLVWKLATLSLAGQQGKAPRSEGGTISLRADLTALLADAGIVDVDIDEAVADGHVRSSAYHKVLAVVVAGRQHDDVCAAAATILRDPDESVSKTAVVELVDRIAMKADDPNEFRQWAAGLIPIVDRLTTEGHRRFLHRRIHDWTISLTIEAGSTPTATELASITDWMQRLLADESTSLPVLTMLAETGSTRKIRIVARNRARNRALRKER
jgi:hypothetical protein